MNSFIDMEWCNDWKEQPDFINVKEIIIENEITNIGDCAFFSDEFSADKIISVTIDADITEIGHHAFRGNEISSIIIPDSVETVYGGAFHSNLLEEIIILRDDEIIFGFIVFSLNGPSQNSGTIETGNNCGRWELSGTSWTRVQTCPLP